VTPIVATLPAHVTPIVTMLPVHRAYVACTWARGQRYGLRTREAFRFVNRVIEGGADIVCLANDETVHAWAASGPDVLHYVYVPPELRRKGFARRLITSLLGEYPERINVTHRWPFESSRFRFNQNLLLRAAA
jgi:GNAT superfamily N-acetyltransferase